MPGRQFNNGNYRYGFNGKEKDNDILRTGQGTQDYGMRFYNPALGRFLSVDTLMKDFAWNSPFSFAENDVCRSIDLDGKEKRIVIKVRDDECKIIAMKITTNIADRVMVNQIINQRNPDGSQSTIQDSDGNAYKEQGVVVIDYNSQGIPSISFKTENDMDKFETDVLKGELKVSNSETNFVRSTPLNKSRGFKGSLFKESQVSEKRLKISSNLNIALSTYEQNGGTLNEPIYLDKSAPLVMNPSEAIKDVLENIEKLEYEASNNQR